jgi:hypothetical protein
MIAKKRRKLIVVVPPKQDRGETVRANLSGESGHAGTTAAKSASPGITLLEGRTAGVRRLAVKICCDNHASWRQASIFKSATI